MQTLVRIIPEDYRATSIAQFPIGVAERGCVVRAIFVPTQDIVIPLNVEAFFRLIARTPGNQRPLGLLRFVRGKYQGDEVVQIKLNTSTTLEGGEVLYAIKEISSGQIAFPESVVQVECR